MATITSELREYFREIGAKGGSVKSEAKAKAAKANGKKHKKNFKAKRKVARRAGVK